MRTSPIIRMAFAMALAAAAVPANAATQAECDAAVAAAQTAMDDSPALAMEEEGKQQEAESILAEASEAGQEGDYDRCLERVEAARSAAGLE